MRHMATSKFLRFISSLMLVALVLAAAQRSALADPPKVGIEKRVAWTSSRIIGSPEVPLPYVTERAFPALKFTNCLDLTNAPGSDRLFVVEQAGKIFSFPNTPGVAAADLVIDLAKTIPGVQVYDPVQQEDDVLLAGDRLAHRAVHSVGHRSADDRRGERNDDHHLARRRS